MPTSGKPERVLMLPVYATFPDESVPSEVYRREYMVAIPTFQPLRLATDLLWCDYLMRKYQRLIDTHQESLPHVLRSEQEWSYRAATPDGTLLDLDAPMSRYKEPHGRVYVTLSEFHEQTP